MKKIYLRGKDKHSCALVDDDNYDVLSKYSWYLNHKGYVQRSRKYVDKIADTLPILMHNMIVDPQIGLVRDHINNNKLDNRKDNLRQITNTENIRRRGNDKRSTTGYKGVYLFKSKELRSTTIRYVSYIRVNKKLIFVGYFDSKEKAALAYNEASEKYHGQYGFQNAT